tara:strand:- start:1001 stop:2128 length:1128 start_codon:yes stop_codon:yes gene_type:complete
MVDKKIMSYNFISSQEVTWSRLVKISKSGNISNAYLFSGATGSGKEGLALMFAQLLNCNNSKSEICFQCDSCIRFKNLQHEKLNIIIPLPTSTKTHKDDYNNLITNEYIEAINKKSLDPFYKIKIPKSKRILIQSIRHLKKKIYLDPIDRGRNIIVIFDSELLCEGQGESGNALLKILEEPPEKTTIILVSDYKNMLFETIISRCQSVDIPPLQDKYILKWLINKKVENAELLVSLCRGDMHKAKSLSSQPTVKIVDTIEKLLNTFIQNNSEQWRSFTDYYSRLCTKDIKEFEYHINLISIWFMGANRQRQGLNSGFDNTKLFNQIVSFNETYPKANIYAIILCLEDVLRSVSQNLYMPLILLNMILDIKKNLDE